MNHIMVCAEFPGATLEQVNEIYTWLSKRNWTRIMGAGNELNNVWYGTFNRQMLEKDCHRVASNNFIEASQKYCTVQLDIIWGANKPATDKLTLLA